MKISNTHRMPRLRSSFWEYVGHYTVPWPAGAIWKNKQKQSFEKKRKKNGKNAENSVNLWKTAKMKISNTHSGNMLEITQYHGLLAPFEIWQRIFLFWIQCSANASQGIFWSCWGHLNKENNHPKEVVNRITFLQVIFPCLEKIVEKFWLFASNPGHVALTGSLALIERK